jgi:FtsH-binding integral membrane protein
MEDRNIIYQDNDNGFNNNPRNASMYRSESTWRAMARSYLYMLIALIISAGIALGGFFGLRQLVINATTDAQIEAISQGYSVAMITSLIGVVVMMFVTSIVAIKGKKGGLACLIIYSVFMGVLLSSVMLVVFAASSDLRMFAETIGWAFLATVGVFGAMTLYGFIAKEHGSALIYGIVGLFTGLLIMTIMNIFMRSETLMWVIGYAYIALLMLYVGFDTWQMKKHAESGQLTDGWAVYYALQLYTDFIYLFVRLAILIAANRQK